MHAAIGSQTGALARLGLAVALSALLHVLLLGGVSIRRQASEEPVATVLTARLERLAVSPGERLLQAATADQGPAPRDVLQARRAPREMPVAGSLDAPPGAPGQSDLSQERQSEPEYQGASVMAPHAALREAAVARSHGGAVSTSLETAKGDAGSTDQRPPPTASASAPPLANFDPRPPMEVPVIVDSTVHETRDLDDLPMSLAPIEPRFPDSAARAGIAGSVTLEVRIDEFGAVREARVVDAVPAGHFEASALEAFRSARFTPAQRDGRAVRCKLVIKVDFTPAVQPLATTQ